MATFFKKQSKKSKKIIKKDYQKRLSKQITKKDLSKKKNKNNKKISTSGKKKFNIYLVYTFIFFKTRV